MASQSPASALCDSHASNAISEEEAMLEWPSPRGEEPLERLRSSVSAFQPLTADQIESAITEASERWDTHTNKWELVRGKHVVNSFASEVSHMRSGAALLEAVAKRRPVLSGLDEFASRLEEALQ
jgi:hypothetical protein